MILIRRKPFIIFNLHHLRHAHVLNLCFMCLHAKIDVRWLVIRRTDRSTADSADRSAFLFPDDDAATGNIALIRHGSYFINGHEHSSKVSLLVQVYCWAVEMA